MSESLPGCLQCQPRRPPTATDHGLNTPFVGTTNQ
jgi:hypothetical protein